MGVTESFPSLPGTIKEAKEINSKFYFNGKPCKNGHVSKRRTSTRVCMECEKTYHRDRYENDKDLLLSQHKAWRENNPEYNNNYYLENKDRRRQYIQENIEHIRKAKRENRHRQYRQDTAFRATSICRGFLYRTLNFTGCNKHTSTANMLGYSNTELLEDIETKMITGMTWDNYGDWHIDHIYPISRFIQDGITDPAIINALDNLIPMWSEHNSQKGTKTLEEYLQERCDLSDVYGHHIEEENLQWKPPV